MSPGRRYLLLESDRGKIPYQLESLLEQVRRVWVGAGASVQVYPNS